MVAYFQGGNAKDKSAMEIKDALEKIREVARATQATKENFVARQSGGDSNPAI